MQWGQSICNILLQCVLSDIRAPNHLNSLIWSLPVVTVSQQASAGNEFTVPLGKTEQNPHRRLK